MTLLFKSRNSHNVVCVLDSHCYQLGMQPSDALRLPTLMVERIPCHLLDVSCWIPARVFCRGYYSRRFIHIILAIIIVVMSHDSWLQSFSQSDDMLRLPTLMVEWLISFSRLLISCRCKSLSIFVFIRVKCRPYDALRLQTLMVKCSVSLT